MYRASGAVQTVDPKKVLCKPQRFRRPIQKSVGPEIIMSCAVLVVRQALEVALRKAAQHRIDPMNAVGGSANALTPPRMAFENSIASGAARSFHSPVRTHDAQDAEDRQ